MSGVPLSEIAEACTFAVAEHCGPVTTLIEVGGITIVYWFVVAFGTATFKGELPGLIQTYTG